MVWEGYCCDCNKERGVRFILPIPSQALDNIHSVRRLLCYKN